MFHFGRDANKPVYGAIFDIGSGTVGIAIVEFDPTQTMPRILYAKRFPMRVTEQSIRREILLRKVREALFSSALTLSQEGLAVLSEHNNSARISTILVTCSSPWSFNLSRTVEYSDDEAFKITESVINDLVHSATETIFSDLKSKERSASESYDVVEQATVDISVNDYSVQDPINLKGNSISLSHIIGLIPKEISSGIQEVQEKLFPGTILKMHTYMLIMYCIIRDVFPKLTSFNIIDVTGEAVEIGVVEHGLLIENNVIPFGSGTLLRQAVELTKQPLSDIVTLFSNFDGTPFKSNVLASLVDNYIDQYAEAIKNIMKNRVISDDIVLTTHRLFVPLYTHMLDMAFRKATGKKRTIVTLDKKLVDEISRGSGDDVYLAFEARFFHKLHGCGEITSK